MINNLSIRAKINISLITTCVAVLAVSTYQTVLNERELTEHVVSQQIQSMADSYFDAVNTMMLTGTMDKRDIYRQKVLQADGVVDARIIRGDLVQKLYGTGNAEQGIQDEWDQQAMDGDEVLTLSRQGNERLLTVVRPLVATADHRGTNCLACHQAQEGDILGAVRISYSLKALDQMVTDNLWSSLLFQIVIFGIGFSAIAVIFRQVAARRLKSLALTMTEMERNTDLSMQLKVGNNDEIGEVSSALNRMVGKFHDSVSEVAITAEKIDASAVQISDIADATRNAILQQKNSTDLMAAASGQLEISSDEVKQKTRFNSEVSQTATDKAEQSSHIARDAVEGIGVLREDIMKSSATVLRLEEQTQEVEGVLAVIGNIAEQTNLLALNAAIEAARAGESGRGFAVVADEVRNLSFRTRESTEEIQVTIASLKKEVSMARHSMETACESADQRSAQIQEVGEALQDIAGMIKEINQLNVQMAAVADEQNQVVSGINQSVADIHHASDESANGADRVKAISDNLVTLARALNDLVMRFKL